MKRKLYLVTLTAILIFTLAACSSTEIESLPVEEDISVEIVDTRETAPSETESIASPLATEEAEEPEIALIEEPVAVSLDENIVKESEAAEEEPIAPAEAEENFPDETAEVVSEDAANESEAADELLVPEPAEETPISIETFVPDPSGSSPARNSLLMIVFAVLSALLVLLFIVSIIIQRKNKHIRRKWESPMR